MAILNMPNFMEICLTMRLLRDEGMTRQTLERDTSGNSQVSTELCGFSWM